MLKLFKRPRSARRSAGSAQPLVERYALNSGERQTATELSGIRGDHVNRYETAISVIEETLGDIGHGFVLDAFCGNGYGTHLLCERLRCHAMGIDASPGAIQCANAHYASNRIFFCQKEFPFDLPKRTFDAATCLESLEHVQGADALVGTLAGALKPGGVLFLSTPNEDIFPHDSATHKFHVRHFRREDVMELVSRTDGDFRLLEWYGQDIYGEDGAALGEDGWQVEPRKEKQILMFAFQKGI